MKLKIAIFLFTLFSTISYAQNEDWNTYDFDSIVGIDMPGEVFELDTVVDYKKMLFIESEYDSMIFRVAKIDLQQRYRNIETINLPVDRKTLKQLYQTFALTELEVRQQDPSDSDDIEIKNLAGYKTVFQNTDKLPYSETYLFFINNHMYGFVYESNQGLNYVQRDLFFNSIQFNDNLQLEQYYENPTTSKTNLMWKIIIGFLGFSFLFRFFTKKKKRPKRIRID
jgi:hypothetical protein